MKIAIVKEKNTLALWQRANRYIKFIMYTLSASTLKIE